MKNKDKLLPMVELVRDAYWSYGNEFITAQEYVEITNKYENFLSKNLKYSYEVNGVSAHPINRFVPCDLEGNVLSEPKPEDYTQEELQASVLGCDYIDYQQAKERVLFEGFEYVKIEGCKSVLINDFLIQFNKYNSKIEGYISKENSLPKYLGYFNTIEQLTQHDLTLTATAQQMIYGN